MKGSHLILATIVFAILGFGYLQFSKSEVVPESRMVPTPTLVVDVNATPTVVVNNDTTKYKDGVYEAVGEYNTPAGPEKVDVTVTIKDNAVTDSKLIQLGRHETSKRMQANFASAYKQEVIGKPIGTIELDVVGGSSLTPKGFMDALNQIKSKAS